MSESHRGERAYQWKNGATARSLNVRKSLEYRVWRESIFARDDWTCQICGERGHHLSLRANHIKRFSDYPELRLDEKNGITICEHCDIRWVLNREPGWESYFRFNLMTREMKGGNYIGR
jgi:5-methylcytosine-specific restriction endonuclease McrA